METNKIEVKHDDGYTYVYEDKGRTINPYVDQPINSYRVGGDE